VGCPLFRGVALRLVSALTGTVGSRMPRSPMPSWIGCCITRIASRSRVSPCAIRPMPRVLAIFCVASLATGVGSTSHALNLPALPLTFDTTYSPPSGSTISVNVGGDFQAALDKANPGDTILLQAGATFIGPFTLPKKGTGTAWIYIQSSAYSNLPPPGTRVAPTDAANMPRIVAPASRPGIVTVNGSHHFRFVGIEFTNAPNVYTYNLVQLDNNDASVATLTNNITFDRCYFLADSTATGVRRGLLANAAYVAVVDSVLEGFRDSGSDSNAILAYNTSGPIKIVNNYLVGAGENVLFGGGDSASVSVVPADIEIRGNYFYKPLSWIGSRWIVKNLLEFKSAIRALVTGNVMQNNWAAAQNGFSVLITPRNQYDKAPWTVTKDITMTNNVLTNLGSGINILGTDDINTSQRTERILIKNNVISVNGLNGASGWVFQILDDPVDVTIDHNTAFDLNAFLFANGTSPQTHNFTFTNNIVAKGTYGLIGTATVDGLSTLNTFFINWTFTANAVIGASSGVYPPGNFFPTNAQAVQFVNYVGSNFTLAALSPYKGAGSDGLDLGANIALIPALPSAGTRGVVPNRLNNLQFK